MPHPVRSPKLKASYVKRLFNMQTVNENIRKFRTDRKWTKDKLATLVGTSISNIHNWETGAQMRSDFVVKLCKAFECTPNELFGMQ